MGAAWPSACPRALPSTQWCAGSESSCRRIRTWRCSRERRALGCTSRVVGSRSGIDAAVVANHHVIVRRPSAGRSRGGGGQLRRRRRRWPGWTCCRSGWRRIAPVMAVAEPTSMTWLPLSIALERAGCSLALVGNRHSARLRSALAGKNKSDPIDADMLSRAGEFFSLQPARIPSPDELALKRACQRRGKLIVDANRQPAADHLAGPVGVPRRVERLRRLPVRRRWQCSHAGPISPSWPEPGRRRSATSSPPTPGRGQRR